MTAMLLNAVLSEEFEPDERRSGSPLTVSLLLCNTEPDHLFNVVLM